MPKLFLKAEPGALLAAGANLATARSWPAQTEVTVKGIHFVQEDSPDEIGRAIAKWMAAVGLKPSFVEEGPALLPTTE
jgi:haloalkane dehalogenase